LERSCFERGDIETLDIIACKQSVKLERKTWGGEERVEIATVTSGSETLGGYIGFHTSNPEKDFGSFFSEAFKPKVFCPESDIQKMENPPLLALSF